MEVWIALGVFVSAMIVWSIYSRKSSVSELEFEDFENLKLDVTCKSITIHGLGPERTVLPNCRLVFTNRRIVVAQKQVFSKKIKIHHYLWWTDYKNLDRMKITDGIVNLSIEHEDVITSDKVVHIVPSNSTFIKRIETDILVEKYNTLISGEH